MPQRSNRVTVVAHCHLNVNTKVRGLAHYCGVREDVVSDLIASGQGIIQLPCPEASWLGMNRWGMTVEQYNTAAYRRHCREILRPTIDTLAELVAGGCEVAEIVGADGSPSCGVSKTCFGYSGGEIESLDELPTATEGPGKGVFIEELQAMLNAAGLSVPIRGVDE